MVSNISPLYFWTSFFFPFLGLFLPSFPGSPFIFFLISFLVLFTWKKTTTVTPKALFTYLLILSFFLGHRERSSNLPPTQILQVGSIAKYKTRDPGRMTLKGLSLWSLVCWTAMDIQCVHWATPGWWIHTALLPPTLKEHNSPSTT